MSRNQSSATWIVDKKMSVYVNCKAKNADMGSGMQKNRR
jgi:hypothetical protein